VSGLLDPREQRVPQELLVALPDRLDPLDLQVQLDLLELLEVLLVLLDLLVLLGLLVLRDYRVYRVYKA
jgi:hypothetical protein